MSMRRASRRIRLLMRQLKIDVLSVLVVTDKLEFELRVTSYELRSKKFRGHSPASMELFDVQWRAVRLAELTIRNS